MLRTSSTKRTQNSSLACGSRFLVKRTRTRSVRCGRGRTGATSRPASGHAARRTRARPARRARPRPARRAAGTARRGSSLRCEQAARRRVRRAHLPARSTTSTPSCISSITRRLSCACWRAISRLPRALSSSRASRRASSPASTAMTKKPLPASPACVISSVVSPPASEAEPGGAEQRQRRRGGGREREHARRQDARHQHRQDEQRHVVEARSGRGTCSAVKSAGRRRSSPAIAGCAGARTPAARAAPKARQQPHADRQRRVGDAHGDDALRRPQAEHAGSASVTIRATPIAARAAMNAR